MNFPKPNTKSNAFADSFTDSEPKSKSNTFADPEPNSKSNTVADPVADLV